MVDQNGEAVLFFLFLVFVLSRMALVSAALSVLDQEMKFRTTENSKTFSPTKKALLTILSS